MAKILRMKKKSGMGGSDGGWGHPISVLAYFSRIGAEVLNFRRAMVKLHRGDYYIERALIRIDADGVVTSSMREYAPTEEELGEMQRELREIDYPKSVLAKNVSGLVGKTKGVLYEFWKRGKDGGIIMVQERREPKEFLPWVQHSDGEWRNMEPDGPLPFWKPKMATGRARIMIHEGAKAAIAVNALLAAGGGVASHPWYEELDLYEHWGMIGGALAPHRSDYEELRGVAPAELVYVCDNDHTGEGALQKVSGHWRGSMKGVKFTRGFKAGWDMADELPASMFVGGRWNGPSLRELMKPATWATDQVPNPNGKGVPANVLRQTFMEEWHHCIRPDVYIHRDWPSQLYVMDEFNDVVAPYSHAAATAVLVKRQDAYKVNSLGYDPSRAPGVYVDSEKGRFYNTYEPATIKAMKGDASLWEEFIKHLIPDELDRTEVIRWCATLVCRTDIKMKYALLLVSERQGVGKSTLADYILTPLLGKANVSHPSERDVVESAFNDWIAHKRLAVIQEIYAGQSSKAYRNLQSIITDAPIAVNKKYQAPYVIENWIHVFACSNSPKALKIPPEDRRWLVPTVTDEMKPNAYWDRLHSWLAYEGGLGVVKWWMEKWLDRNGCVAQGGRAPATKQKINIIEEGLSAGQTIVFNVLAGLKRRIEDGELSDETFVLDTDLRKLIRDKLYDGRHNDKLESLLTIRNVAKLSGWYVGKEKSTMNRWGYEGYGARVIAYNGNIARLSPVELAGAQISENDKKNPIRLEEPI